MARTYLIFGDIEGKLDMLRIECSKRPRKGRYSVAKLIEKYGRRANMMKWKQQLNGDCPKRDGRLYDRCDLLCPDLSRWRASRSRSAIRCQCRRAFLAQPKKYGFTDAVRKDLTEVVEGFTGRCDETAARRGME
jgi:hypothetical protein